MDYYVQVSLVVLSFSVFALVLLFIFLLYEIWKPVKGVTAILHTLSESLPAILQNLEDITATMNKMTKTVSERVEGLSNAAKKFQDLLGLLADLQQIILAGVGRPIFGVIRTTTAISRGIKVFAGAYRSSQKK